MGGQIQVSSDQWLVLLYANYMYNAEDSWNGLLRSGLLVSVSLSLDLDIFCTTMLNDHNSRPSSTFSCPQAQLIKHQGQHILEMPVFMVCAL